RPSRSKDRVSRASRRAARPGRAGRAYVVHRAPRRRGARRSRRFRRALFAPSRRRAARPDRPADRFSRADESRAGRGGSSAGHATRKSAPSFRDGAARVVARGELDAVGGSKRGSGEKLPEELEGTAGRRSDPTGSEGFGKSADLGATETGRRWGNPP